MSTAYRWPNGELVEFHVTKTHLEIKIYHRDYSVSGKVPLSNYPIDDIRKVINAIDVDEMLLSLKEAS